MISREERVALVRDAMISTLLLVGKDMTDEQVTQLAEAAADAIEPNESHHMTSISREERVALVRDAIIGAGFNSWDQARAAIAALSTTKADQ